MKLLYYIPGFGSPNTDIKYEILNHNISYIYNQIKNTFDISINFYTPPSPKLISSIQKNHCINQLLVYEKKGVLTELFLTNPNNLIIEDYNYIFFILDDVKIIDIDIMRMIEIKETNNFEILSPKIINSTHSFMNHLSQGLSINNFLEVYLLLLTPKDFSTFLSIHTVDNKWMWGVDFLFGHYNIKVGVAYNFIVEHMLPSDSNGNEASFLMIQYLKQNTPYNCLNDINNKYKPIKNMIETLDK